MLTVRQISSKLRWVFSFRYRAELVASWRKAGLLRAERVNKLLSGRITVRLSIVSGASETITWALVPLKPNALTPAIRGCPTFSQGKLS